MTTTGIYWRRIEAGLVGLAGLHGLGEGVLDFEDDVFRALHNCFTFFTASWSEFTFVCFRISAS